MEGSVEGSIDYGTEVLLHRRFNGAMKRYSDM